MVALVAPSGAGKSTLLHIAGLLERPDAGEVVDLRHGRPASSPMPSAPRSAALQIGFVYQFHHLLPEFTALENIMMPQLIRGIEPARRRSARHAAACLYAGPEARHAPPVGTFRRRAAARRDRPRRRQRARGCSWPTSRPAISIRRPSGIVFDGLTQLVRASKLAALIATHNHDLAARMDRRITLKDGKVVEME